MRAGEGDCEAEGDGDLRGDEAAGFGGGKTNFNKKISIAKFTEFGFKLRS